MRFHLQRIQEIAFILDRNTMTDVRLAPGVSQSFLCHKFCPSLTDKSPPQKNRPMFAVMIIPDFACHIKLTAGSGDGDAAFYCT